MDAKFFDWGAKFILLKLRRKILRLYPIWFGNFNNTVDMVWHYNMIVQNDKWEMLWYFPPKFIGNFTYWR